MKRKGTTIIEMVIVMAVTTIISIMVVSFSMSANTWINLGTDELHLLQEERQIEAAMDSFLEAFDKSDLKFELAEAADLSDGESGIKVAVDGRTYLMKFAKASEEDEDDLSGTLSVSILNIEEYEKDKATLSTEEFDQNISDNKYDINISVKCEFTESIEFTVETTGATADAPGKQMVICKCNYKLSGSYSKEGEEGSYFKVYTTVIPKLLEVAE